MQGYPHTDGSTPESVQVPTWNRLTSATVIPRRGGNLSAPFRCIAKNPKPGKELRVWTAGRVGALSGYGQPPPWCQETATVEFSRERRDALRPEAAGRTGC